MFPVSLFVCSLIAAVVLAKPTSRPVTETAARREVTTTLKQSSSCTATEYSQISAAVQQCTQIVLQDITMPSNTALDLSKLKANTIVSFAGLTTFNFTSSSSFTPIVFGGKGITIQGQDNAAIDGQGQKYWDGQGSNGGTSKPDHFIVVKLTGGSVIENLRIQNWPVHLFSIESSQDLTLRNLVLDNSAGDSPNSQSGSKAAGHNTDAFDISNSENILISNSKVYNQDDCVAINSGNNITVTGLTCSGSHGLSIGSVGGRSNNNVTNVLFTESTLINSQNGARIKTNYDTTGLVSDITYSNINLVNIQTYGIDVQQDYLNGGPTGTPTSGVIIKNVLFKNITGTVSKNGVDYYVLCGSSSCSNIQFLDVKITGGPANASKCNFPASGCPQ